MVEKVSDRARKRVAQPKNAATIARLRSQETVSQPDAPSGIAQVEQAPKLNKIVDNRRSDQNPKSKKVVQKLKDAPASAGRFIGNHKKGSIAALVALLVMAALFVGSIVVSGPMQFMQFTGLVKSSIQFMSDSVSSTRLMRNVVNVAQGATITVPTGKSNRIEQMGRMLTDSYTKQLADRGIKFAKGSSMITIDLGVRYGNDSFNEAKIKQRLSDELGVGASGMTYDSVNNTVTFSTSGSGWDDAQNSKFLLALEEEIGNPSIKQVSALRRNKMTMRLGLYTWLHPINHADQVALRQTMGHLEAWYASRLLKMTGQEINGQITDELADELKSVLDKKMAQRATNIDIDKLDGSSESWMMLALAMACVGDRTNNSTRLYSKVIVPAIIEALAVRSIEGEISAIALNTLNRGLQDFTYDDLAGPVRDFFYDTFLTSSGSVPVSGWSSAPVKAALGDSVNDVDITNTVDYALRLWELRDEVRGDQNPATIVGDWVQIRDLCQDFFANDKPTEAINNFLASAVSGGAAGVLDWIKGKFDIRQTYWPQKVEGIKEYSLQTFGMDPSQKLSTVMYGSKFLEDFDNSTLGGRKLSDDEVAVLYSSNQIKLAGEYQDSSVLRRLFDPTDYRSALSKVARQNNWDTSGGSAVSHLANVANTLARIPATLLVNVRAVFRDQASAASNSPYDYGVGWYGYSVDEQQRLRDIDNPQSSVFKNAENLYEISSRDLGDVQLNSAATSCFSTYIASNTMLAKINNSGANILNKEGSFNIDYIGGPLFDYDDCYHFQLNYDEMMILRTYILDYQLLSAGSCYEASVYPDETFDSNGDGIDDMTYRELGIHTCADFTAGQGL